MPSPAAPPALASKRSTAAVSSLRMRASAAASAPAASSPSRAAPTIGGASVTWPERPGPISRRPAVDRREQARVARAEHAAAEHHLDALAGQVEALERDARERDHLGREAIDDLGRDRIARRLGVDQRSELDHRALRDLAAVHRLRQLRRRAQAVVRRDRVLERGARPAAVLAARRGGDGREPDVVAAAPVAGDRAERGKPHLAAVPADADAVDAGAAGDGDAPAARRARAQHGERVVADDRPRHPAARREGGGDLLLLARVVDAGEQEDARLGERGCLRDARLPRGVVDQPGEHGQRALDADVVLRALRAPHEREQRAVDAQQREVGLRVPAVDGEHERTAHRLAPPCAAKRGRCASSAASSRSISSSVGPHWPTSGCASSALRASARSPLSAAATASRS